ncbi:unnamed protein product, partial [Vitis vinifera]
MESCVQLQPPSLLNSQNSSSKLRFYSCTTKVLLAYSEVEKLSQLGFVCAAGN